MQLDNLEDQIRLEQEHWWFRARRRIIGNIVRALVAPSKEALIVDVGCGVGVDAQALATDYEVTGIDQWEEAIDLAARCFPAVRFICGNAPDDLGDLVHRTRLFLVTDFLEHVEDDRALFQPLVEAARPGTYFLLTVPTVFADWSARDPREDDFPRYNAARFMRIWSYLPVEEVLFAWADCRFRWPLRLPLVPTLTGLARPREFNALPSPPPRFINWMLEKALVSESRRLLKQLRGPRRCGYRAGTTLLAVLRKKQG